MHLLLNGQPYEFKAESTMLPPTITTLVQTLGFTGKRIAVERNGDIVPKSRYSVVELEDQDRLEIIVAVGGG